MAVLDFLASSAGRWVRAIVGVALIALAIALGGWWWILGAVGVVFVLVGLFDVCLLAPLFGRAFRGRDYRAAE